MQLDLRHGAQRRERRSPPDRQGADRHVRTRSDANRQVAPAEAVSVLPVPVLRKRFPEMLYLGAEVDGPVQTRERGRTVAPGSDPQLPGLLSRHVDHPDLGKRTQSSQEAAVESLLPRLGLRIEPHDGRAVPGSLAHRPDLDATTLEASPQARKLGFQPRGLALGVGSGPEAHPKAAALSVDLASQAADVSHGPDRRLQGLEPGPGQIGEVGALGQPEIDRQLRKAPGRQKRRGQAQAGDDSQQQDSGDQDQASHWTSHRTPRPIEHPGSGALGAPLHALPRRTSARWRIGTTKSVAKNEVTRPPLTATANAPRSSTPWPPNAARGTMPSRVVRVVIKIGR